MSDVTVRARRHAAVWNAGLPVRVAPAALTRRPLLLVFERLADPKCRLLAVLRRAAASALRVCQSVLVAPERHGGTCVGMKTLCLIKTSRKFNGMVWVFSEEREDKSFCTHDQVSLWYHQLLQKPNSPPHSRPASA